METRQGEEGEIDRYSGIERGGRKEGRVKKRVVKGIGGRGKKKKQNVHE